MAFTGGAFDIISLAIAIVALTTKGWVRTALMALSGDIKQYTLLYLPFMWKDVGGYPHTPNAKELAKNVVIPLTVFLTQPFVVSATVAIAKDIMSNVPPVKAI